MIFKSQYIHVTNYAIFGEKDKLWYYPWTKPRDKHFLFLISPLGDFLQKFLYIFEWKKNPVGKNIKKNIGKRENIALFQQITNGSHKKTC